MTKTHADLDWICKLHDSLNVEMERERIYYEKHYGHKPYVLAQRLSENTIVYEMAHEMLDHMHRTAVASTQALRGMVRIEIPLR